MTPEEAQALIRQPLWKKFPESYVNSAPTKAERKRRAKRVEDWRRGGTIHWKIDSSISFGEFLAVLAALIMTCLAVGSGILW